MGFRSSSCKDCEKRYVGCHSECESYKQDVKRWEEEKEKVRNGERQDKLLRTYKYESIEKYKKGRGIK